MSFDRFALPILLTIAVVLAAVSVPANAQGPPESDYSVYVVSEAADSITLVRFGRNGARVDRNIETGSMPSDIDGPHGIVVSPDRNFY